MWRLPSSIHSLHKQGLRAFGSILFSDFHWVITFSQLPLPITFQEWKLNHQWMEYEIQEHLHKQSPLVPIWPVHLLDLPTKNRVLQTLFKLVVLTVLGKKTWRKRYNKICDLLKLYLKKIDGVFSTWYPEDIYKCLVFVVMNCLWSKTMPLWIDEASDTLPLLWPYFV